MEKKLQDLAWKSAPKEFREQVKKMVSDKENYTYEQMIVIRLLYGDDNLFSDTETEEMLMILRKEVQKLYRTLELERRNVDFGLQDKILYDGKLDMLDELFGDKCLPDKELRLCDKCVHETHGVCKINIGCDGALMSTYDRESCDDYKPKEQPSVQVEPKFKVGDKVIHNHKNREVGEVAAYFPDEKFCYSVRFGKEYHNMAGHQLEPYTEPEYRNISQFIANCDKPEDNQLKDNMEEKELNLLDIINDSHIGETFYSLIEGYVKFEGIEPHWKEYGMKPLRFAEGNFNPDGTYQTKPNASCCIWPSKELYEKYPLDAKKAWDEWKESRKQKYILEVEVSSWFDGEDGRENEKYDGKKWFKFDSAMELKQAAEAVRECLEKFHQKGVNP